ncbi:type VII secretion protein EccE [Embleya sp. NPDC020630]|uniref:type VII secretion protein EccE n=1 Tax=Embleya sp. NPDC020630 TaxID=3363979 RepID=UPI0037927B95
MAAPAPVGTHRQTRPPTPPDGSSPQTPPQRASLRVHPRAGRIGGVLVQQIVLIQLAVLLVAIGLATNPAVLIGLGAVAIVLVVPALVRLRGRWLAQWLPIVYDFRRRRRMPAVPDDADPVLVPVLECAPRLTTSSVTDRDRRSIGLIGDGTFLTAVLLVTSRDEPLRPSRAQRPLPLPAIVSTLDVDDVTLASVQVVQHTQPAPATHLPEEALATRSYRQLVEQGLHDVPALRLTWIALRFEPELCAGAVAARGGGEEGAQRALLRAVNQLAGNLTGAGFEARALDETELVQALATSCSVNRTTRQYGRGGRRTTESKRAWRCDDRWHTTYWANRWPQLTQGRTSDLVGALTATPAIATTFALTATHGVGGTTALTTHVRIAARSGSELADVTRQLERRARSERIGLTRLDWEQQPALLATLPLGGLA